MSRFIEIAVIKRDEKEVVTLNKHYVTKLTQESEGKGLVWFRENLTGAPVGFLVDNYEETRDELMSEDVIMFENETADNEVSDESQGVEE